MSRSEHGCGAEGWLREGFKSAPAWMERVFRAERRYGVPQRPGVRTGWGPRSKGYMRAPRRRGPGFRRTPRPVRDGDTARRRLLPAGAVVLTAGSAESDRLQGRRGRLRPGPSEDGPGPVLESETPDPHDPMPTLISGTPLESMFLGSRPLDALVEHGQIYIVLTYSLNRAVETKQGLFKYDRPQRTTLCGAGPKLA